MTLWPFWNQTAMNFICSLVNFWHSSIWTQESSKAFWVDTPQRKWYLRLQVLFHCNVHIACSKIYFLMKLSSVQGNKNCKCRRVGLGEREKSLFSLVPYTRCCILLPSAQFGHPLDPLSLKKEGGGGCKQSECKFFGTCNQRPWSVQGKTAHLYMLSSSSDSFNIENVECSRKYDSEKQQMKKC